MTKTWIKASLIPIVSLFLTQCGNGGSTADIVENQPGLSPIIPAPIPAPTPDPEPGPIDPGLGAPGNLSATEGVYSDKIEVRWEPIPGASYKLFRKTANASAYTQVYSGSEVFYTDTTAVSGQTYQYAVKALNAQSQSSALSAFDTGWRAFSAGCAVKLNSQASQNRIGLLRNGFRAASAIAIRGNNTFIAGGDRVVMLNSQRDLIGVWPEAGGISAMTATAGSPVYALADKQVLRLGDDCGIETFATLPYNTQGFDITMDISGNVYVSERSSEKPPRIFRFDTAGKLINEWYLPDAGNSARSLNSLHWTAENALLIADRTGFRLKKYQIENNQLVKTAERGLAVIGEPTDIATYGNNILVFVKANDKMNLIRYHSGFDGGAVIYDVGYGFRMHVTEAAMNPADGTLYATDEAGRQLLACPQPLFICNQESAGISPIGMTVDTQKNLYVLHAAPTGSIAKLNANGAQLGLRLLPDYQNRAVAPFGIEADGDYLYVSATNGQKLLIVKIKNDLSGTVTFTERAGNSQEFFDLAASAGRIVSEQRMGYASGEDYLTKATFEAIETDGSKVQLPEYILPAQLMWITSSKVETCSAAVPLYFQVTGFDDNFEISTFLARLTPQQNSWVPVALPAGKPRIKEVRCAKTNGTLFSLDSDTSGNMSVAQRGADLTETRRFNAGRGLINSTFAVATDASAAFAATSDSINRFAPAQISLAPM